MLTLGAFRAIRDAGLTIPDNIAIVAFDDLEWMTLMQPQLTVAAQPTYELGHTAAELLFSPSATASVIVRSHPPA